MTICREAKKRGAKTCATYGKMHERALSSTSMGGRANELKRLPPGVYGIWKNKRITFQDADEGMRSKRTRGRETVPIWQRQAIPAPNIMKLGSKCREKKLVFEKLRRVRCYISELDRGNGGENTNQDIHEQ